MIWGSEEQGSGSAAGGTFQSHLLDVYNTSDLGSEDLSNMMLVWMEAETKSSEYKKKSSKLENMCFFWSFPTLITCTFNEPHDARNTTESQRGGLWMRLYKVFILLISFIFYS